MRWRYAPIFILPFLSGVVGHSPGVEPGPAIIPGVDSPMDWSRPAPSALPWTTGDPADQTESVSLQKTEQKPPSEPIMAKKRNQVVENRVRPHSGKGAPITIFLCGDVMTGRGIDQILPHAGDPRIFESYVKDARIYLDLAEKVNGPIRAPVSFSYIWGEALEELERVAPDLRLVNLETSITTSDDYWRGKGINYRMHPNNATVLTAADIDACSLANNHVLDWGYAGLSETLETLRKMGVKSTGAGRNLRQAESPAVLYAEGKGRVIVFSFGTPTSGIPDGWAASAKRPGVNLLRGLSASTIRRIRQRVLEIKQPRDVVIVSIHWGGNWGYHVPREQIEFAHQLIDSAGVDIIHGHSSHHVKGFEVYRDRLILYGSGDFLNDYEGISGHESFRSDLTLMYFASLDPATGKLVRLQMAPLQMKNFRLNRPSRQDVQWLQSILNREGEKFGTHVELVTDPPMLSLARP